MSLGFIDRILATPTHPLDLLPKITENGHATPALSGPLVWQKHFFKHCSKNGFTQAFCRNVSQNVFKRRFKASFKAPHSGSAEREPGLRKKAPGVGKRYPRCFFCGKWGSLDRDPYLSRLGVQAYGFREENSARLSTPGFGKPWRLA